jgi:phosphohistidine phosphatase
MKELYLFRHAKTHPAAHPGEDHARSLTKTGHDAATQVGARMAADGRRPQLIMSSDAQRTMQTASRAMTSLGLDDQVMPLAELYEAGASDILSLLAGRGETAIMIVGHNPGIEEAVELLTGSIQHMRPGYCLWLRFAIDSWEELYGHPPAEAHRLYKPDDDRD